MAVFFMRDKRPVDELSIEELERILAIKKREARMARASRYRERGRTLNDDQIIAPAPIHEQPPQQTPVISNAAEAEATEPVAASPQIKAPMVDPEKVAFVEDFYQGSGSGSDLMKRVTSWGLLLVEGAAVLGLVYVLYLGFTGLDRIQDNTNRTQEELAAAQEANRVTATPLPELAPYQLIIPGGHTFSESGNHAFNFGELDQSFELNNVPQNLRPAIEAQASTSTISFDTPIQANAPINIDIPDIGITAGTIQRGADWETLQAGMGWLENGANLSNGQNVVVVGHNDIYGEIFKELENLPIGAEITVYDNSGRRYTYVVDSTEIVQPTDVRVLEPTSGADLTLITCYPYRVNDRRYIVYARRIN